MYSLPTVGVLTVPEVEVCHLRVSPPGLPVLAGVWEERERAVVRPHVSPLLYWPPRLPGTSHLFTCHNDMDFFFTSKNTDNFYKSSDFLIQLQEILITY